MKYPERMGRRGGGTRPFHTAVATTFSVEFAAYEEVMLPQLMASGATNLLTIADERMASMSLSDGSQLPSQLGREYALFSPPVSDGLFHPKIVLQIGRKVGRLFVGSANITAAGLAGNAEAVTELECQDEPSPEREIIRSAWRYVSSLVPQTPSAARDALNWAVDRASWLIGSDSQPLQQLEDGTGIAFLARDGGAGIASRFLDLIEGHVVERLVVASPYWDKKLDALGRLVDRLEPGNTTVLLDTEGHEFPITTSLPEGVAFRTFPTKFDGRFKHAKFVIASTASHDHVLLGSANCTTAAMGREGFGGANHEACLYRSLPRDRAIEALGLMECVEGETVGLDEIGPQQATPPIPLSEIASRRPGSFELDGAVLKWSPPASLNGMGQLMLFDSGGSEIDSIVFEIRPVREDWVSLTLPFERPERASFVVAEQDGFRSNRAYITHRGLLRRSRRELATGALAKAVATFDAGNDFDLWMHGAFEELARADLRDRPAPKLTVRQRRQEIPLEEEAPRELTYEEFMETRASDVRADSSRNSTLTGTHSDSIRDFLNMLVGRTTGLLTSGEVGDAWMDLGDEDEERTLDLSTPEIRQAPEPVEMKPNETPVDARQFERMVRAYVMNVANHPDAFGSSDVLRVRFWLMLLLHKAKHDALPHGLGTNSEEQGWPRMALRIISAFFCGRTPPITRLMIAKEYTEMPVDFLECWATILWTIDAIDSLLAGSVRHRQFLTFVRQARAAVIKMLGLTQAELLSETVTQMREALDRTLGYRLGLRAELVA